MDRKRKKISAFGSAWESHSVCAEITVGDIQALRPHWTRQQADAFLRRHEGKLGRAMVAHGLAILMAIMPGDSDDN